LANATFSFDDHKKSLMRRTYGQMLWKLDNWKFLLTNRAENETHITQAKGIEQKRLTLQFLEKWTSFPFFVIVVDIHWNGFYCFIINIMFLSIGFSFHKLWKRLIWEQMIQIKYKMHWNWSQNELYFFLFERLNRK